jgi:hypothetical protein
MQLSNLDLVNRWNAIPLATRLAILIESIIESDRHATKAVRSLISTAAIMATHLSAADRSVIAWHMRMEASTLDVTQSGHEVELSKDDRGNCAISI